MTPHHLTLIEEIAEKCAQALLRRPPNSATSVQWIISTALTELYNDLQKDYGPSLTWTDHCQQLHTTIETQKTKLDEAELMLVDCINMMEPQLGVIHPIVKLAKQTLTKLRNEVSQPYMTYCCTECDESVDVLPNQEKVSCPNCKTDFRIGWDSEYEDGMWHDLTTLTKI